MYNLPNITKNLLIINVLAFLAGWVLELRGFDLNAIGGLHFFLANDFHLYQFVTYLFLHGGFTHLFFNMFGLWMFGQVIERVWGPRKFLFYYISCGIGAGLIQEIAQFVSFYTSVNQAVEIGLGQIIQLGRQYSEALNTWTTIGASGSIYAILLAFGMIFPNERLFIIPFPFPIKAKWLVVGYIAIELFSALQGPGDGVAHTAHLGGMLFGFLMIRYWNSHPGSNANFGRSRGQEFFDNLKRSFDQRKNTRQQPPHTDPRRETDAEYNARKRKNQEEIDAILDKIRKSGYDSLTKEEKKRLFDQSKQ